MTFFVSIHIRIFETAAWRKDCSFIFFLGAGSLRELYIPRKEELFNKRIYITRGGVIAGEYINKCYIKHNNFYPRDPVIINCSRITNHDDIDIYTVDSRSPKLKVLKEFYNVSINIDDKYKHIDIRKFKKL